MDRVTFNILPTIAQNMPAASSIDRVVYHCLTNPLITAVMGCLAGAFFVAYLAQKHIQHLSSKKAPSTPQNTQPDGLEQLLTKIDIIYNNYITVSHNNNNNNNNNINTLTSSEASDMVTRLGNDLSHLLSELEKDYNDVMENQVDSITLDNAPKCLEEVIKALKEKQTQKSITIPKVINAIKELHQKTFPSDNDITVNITHENAHVYLTKIITKINAAYEEVSKDNSSRIARNTKLVLQRNHLLEAIRGLTGNDTEVTLENYEEVIEKTQSLLSYLKQEQTQLNDKIATLKKHQLKEGHEQYPTKQINAILEGLNLLAGGDAITQLSPEHALDTLNTIENILQASEDNETKWLDLISDLYKIVFPNRILKDGEITPDNLDEYIKAISDELTASHSKKETVLPTSVSNADLVRLLQSKEFPTTVKDQLEEVVKAYDSSVEKFLLDKTKLLKNVDKLGFEFSNIENANLSMKELYSKLVNMCSRAQINDSNISTMIVKIACMGGLSSEDLKAPKTKKTFLFHKKLASNDKIKPLTDIIESLLSNDTPVKPKQDNKNLLKKKIKQPKFDE